MTDAEMAERFAWKQLAEAWLQHDQAHETRALEELHWPVERDCEG